jgi:Sulfatase
MHPNMSSHPAEKGWRLWLRSFFLSFALVTLLSSAFIGMLFAAGNRQTLLWMRSDTIALFTGLALISILAAIVFSAFDRWTTGRLSRWGSNLVFLVLSIAFIQLISVKFITQFIIDDVFYGIVLLAGFVISLWSFHHPENRIKSKLWSFLTVLGILPFLLLANLLAFPSLSGSDDFPPVPTTSADPIKPPVIICSFDSIAHVAFTSSSGKIRTNLPVLHSFQNESIDFSMARSPGRCTTVSTPNFLFQRDPETYCETLWTDEWLQENPLSFTNGIFYAAKQEGYRTSLVGIYLPFKQMFGKLLDSSSVRPYFAFTLSSNFFPQMRNLFLHIMKYFHAPLPKRWMDRWPNLQFTRRAYHQYYYDLNLHIAGSTREFLRAGFRTHDFLFVDVPIPHNPFVFMPDGSYSTDASYDTQLEYVDGMFGAFLQAMKESGVYDQAWVIFTSDHGEWDTRNHEKNHVPLLIKPPARTYASRQINETVRMWEMGAFFQAVFQGKPTDECLALLPGYGSIDSENSD